MVVTFFDAVWKPTIVSTVLSKLPFAAVVKLQKKVMRLVKTAKMAKTAKRALVHTYRHDPLDSELNLICMIMYEY